MKDERYKKALFYVELASGAIIFNTLLVHGDYRIAERSFLTINKSGKQLLDWEIKLVDNRDSSFARAVMSIASTTSAPHYWPEQLPESENKNELALKIKEIIAQVEYIQRFLFLPDYVRPVRRLGQPLLVAIGDNRPFYVAELLTIISGYRGFQGETEKLLEGDRHLHPSTMIENGHELVTKVKNSFDNIIGPSPKSLGIISLLYFYKSDGTYIRSLLYGLLYWLLQGSEAEVRVKKEIFSAYRGLFESFLLNRKDEIVSAIGRKVGSGPEVTVRTAKYFQDLLQILHEYQGDINSEDFQNAYTQLFSNLPGQKILAKRDKELKSRLFSPRQKSTTFIDQILTSLPVCGICGGKINLEDNVQFDHIAEYSKQGATSVENAQIVHPFCNNRKREIEAISQGKSNVQLPDFYIEDDNENPAQMSFFKEFGWR